MAPIPVCAGCGLEPVSSETVFCVLCTARLAVSTPFRWAAPTAAVAVAPTLEIGRYSFDRIGPGPVRCGLHGDVIADRRCVSCDDRRG